MEINAAVIFEPSGRFSLEKLELDEPKDNEVLVRIVDPGYATRILRGGTSIYRFRFRVYLVMRGRESLRRLEGG